ncbi:MAG: hypothetical protein MH252_19045 [Thermosynechococcaceae cyanobacterium MS004]|nr:hypothetical protein [Thermosynechococcaceae cyanobacterium MS004]
MPQYKQVLSSKSCRRKDKTRQAESSELDSRDHLEPYGRNPLKATNASEQAIAFPKKFILDPFQTHFRLISLG